MRVICNYCGRKAKLVSGTKLYPTEYKFSNKQYYVCKGCDARVGCHKDTNKPLGTLANKKLRVLRMEAHKAFDPWQETMTKSEAYRWLSIMMRLPKEKCHIGLFDENQCEEVIKICNLKEK